MEGSGDCWRALVMIGNGKTVEMERRQDKEEKKNNSHCILLLHTRPCEKLGESIYCSMCPKLCEVRGIFTSPLEDCDQSGGCER